MTIANAKSFHSFEGLKKLNLDKLTEEMHSLANSYYQKNFSQLETPDYSFGAVQPDINLLNEPIEQALHYYYFPNVNSSQLKIHDSPRMNGQWDVTQIRQDFPILHQKVHNKPLIWFDSAATSQKPLSVINALAHYYECDNANVHRSGHTLGKRATEDFEQAREKVQNFLGAASPEEIIFLRGTTEAINLVAQSYGRTHVQAGDEILITGMEHHSNIVSWQLLCKEKGAILRVIPFNYKGEILLEEYATLLNARTRIVALSHASNVLGTILPIQEMISMARRCPSCVVLVDGAQAVPHFPVNVQELDADFYAFSGHKLFGPTGIGVLYGKKHLLEAMPPWQGGGNMIHTVSYDETTFNDLPNKFEAGTNNIGGAVGLGAAIDYLNHIGYGSAIRYEESLLAYATNQLMTIPGIEIFGNAPHKVAVISFVIKGMESPDVSEKLDAEGIAVRGGHHCAQPLLRFYGYDTMVRASFAFYNTIQEIDVFVSALRKLTYLHGSK